MPFVETAGGSMTGMFLGRPGSSRVSLEGPLLRLFYKPKLNCFKLDELPSLEHSSIFLRAGGFELSKVPFPEACNLLISFDLLFLFFCKEPSFKLFLSDVDLPDERLSVPPLFLLRLLDFDNTSLFCYLRYSSASFCISSSWA